MNFLCDTNVVSEIMKRSPNADVRQWLTERDEIFLSVITVEEIHCGLAYKDASKQLKWFEKFVQSRCHVMPITQSIAANCGSLRGQFRQNGITRTQADLLIAATAIEHSLVVATRNVQDFNGCGVQIFNPFGD
ncbi:MAG: type II toxin-antitoxin system VapC family toxin [Chloroflexota bacterium]